MLCQACGKTEAIVRFTDMVDGEKRQFWLCPACVVAKGVVLEPAVFATVAPLPPAVENLITPVIEALKSSVQKAAQTSRDPDKTCPECSITFAEFKKRGRLGCPHDYVAFEEELGALLEKIHGRSEHRGKVPQTVKNRRAIRHRLDAIRRELEQAVQEEDYERAASLRDRLRDLQKSDGDSDD